MTERNEKGTEEPKLADVIDIVSSKALIQARKAKARSDALLRNTKNVAQIFTIRQIRARKVTRETVEDIKKSLDSAEKTDL